MKSNASELHENISKQIFKNCLSEWQHALFRFSQFERHKIFLDFFQVSGKGPILNEKTVRENHLGPILEVRFDKT